MIVQTAPASEPRMVITMAEHTSLAGAFCAAFGNAEFEPATPREEMLHVVSNHDAGWAGLDAEGRLDPKTGLPFNLVETPFELIIRTSTGSPDFNTRRSAFCGLLSSMHSWGLYNGRYGLSDTLVLDGLAGENRQVADRILGAEVERQEKLKAIVASDPSTAPWVGEKKLFQCYKQLQFFDTLALYFNYRCAADRKPSSFPHVPKDAGEDVTVSITPRGDGSYAMAPFPFAGNSLEASFTGRRMVPTPGRERVDLASLPPAREAIRIVRG
ncbi:MAG: DUF3891 family protein [Alphaproteobacteria bacterium]